MPDALDQFFAGRVYRPPSWDDSFPMSQDLSSTLNRDVESGRPAFIPPDANYNPNLDVPGLVQSGFSPVMARRLQGYRAAIHAKAAQQRAQQQEQDVAPQLAQADPNSSMFSQELNDIFSKSPNALASPKIQSLLKFKEGIRPHQPVMSGTDIADPELAVTYQQRQQAGIPDRVNQQRYQMEKASKGKRLDLIAAGMAPESVRDMMDEDGNIDDEAYAYQLNRLKNSGQKVPSPDDLGHIAKFHQSALMEGSPSDDAKSMWLANRYPKQKQYTEDQWSEAYRALTPAKSTMQLMLQQMADQGYALSPVLLHQYGVSPSQAPRWDVKGKRLMNAPTLPAAPLTERPEIPTVNSQEEYEKIPKGAQFIWNGKTATKK